MLADCSAGLTRPSPSWVLPPWLGISRHLCTYVWDIEGYALPWMLSMLRYHQRKQRGASRFLTRESLLQARVFKLASSFQLSQRAWRTSFGFAGSETWIWAMTLPEGSWLAPDLPPLRLPSG